MRRRRNIRAKARRARSPVGRSGSQQLTTRAMATLIAGSTSSINRPAAIPVSRSFKLHWVEIEVAVVNTIQSSTGQTLWFPAAIELATYSPEGQRVARTGPFMVGPNPRRVRLRHPANMDWYPYDITTPIYAIDCLCMDKRMSAQIMAHCTLAARFSVSTPDASEACPSLISHTQSEGQSVYEFV